MKIFLCILVTTGICLEKSTSIRTRPAKRLNKQQIKSSEDTKEWIDDDFRDNASSQVRDNKDFISRFNDDQDDIKDKHDNDWFKQDGGGTDPLLARQQDFDRWLKKRGSAPVEQDPDAARVASRQAELQELLQQLYEAQAAVKMETSEVSRTQQVAQEAQAALEEATNKVRMLSADLQSAQEAAAAAAMRAHTAQLQLSAHDQLMFTARQRVDALSAQMVSVQADLAAAQQAFTLNNSSHLLEAQGRILDPSKILPPHNMVTNAGHLNKDLQQKAMFNDNGSYGQAVLPAFPISPLEDD